MYGWLLRPNVQSSNGGYLIAGYERWYAGTRREREQAGTEGNTR